MSRQPRGPAPVGAMESIACVVVTFHVKQATGHVLTEEADCLITSTIGSLKRDLERQLGPANKQNWYYKDELMSNDRTLRSYEITGYDDDQIIIEVRPSD